MKKKTSKKSAKILKLPLEVRAEMALKAAVRKAIERHARLGVPVHIWRDGKVVEMSPRDIRKFLASKE